MFDPYHKFSGNTRLEKWVKDHRATITEATYSAFATYHWSVIHKLKVAHHQLTNLEQLLTTCDNTSITNPHFLFQINMCADVFLYAGAGAMDVLAREVLALCGLSLSGNIYYTVAHQRIMQANASHSLLSKLTDPSWSGELRDYRNASTHELLVTTNLSLQLIQEGDLMRTITRVPLPDDPRVHAANRTFKRNPDGLKYFQSTFKRLLTHVNQVYATLCDLANDQNSLPIQI